MNINNFSIEKSFALELDSNDPLKNFRNKFYIPKDKNGNDIIYLCGNSLGLQPKTARDYIDQELKDWEKMGIEGVTHAKRPWIHYHEFLTRSTANLVGALPIEVINMNSLTVNLHLMMISFYRPTKSKYKILIEASAFPSDIYAVTSQIKFHGFDPKDALLIAKPRQGETTIRTEDIFELIEREGDSIALIMFAGVNYYTGQAFDMKEITEMGHKKNCFVGFDLAHASGNLELKLHEWNIDFAVWCSYKYLNAGPGAIAGCFIHEKHSKELDIPRLSGWWGHDKQTRFLMRPEFIPIKGAEGWQLSNPPIFQMAALKASLDIFDEVGIPKLRKKSLQLTNFTEFLIKEFNKKNKSIEIEIITPENTEERGCQLSLRTFNNGKEIYNKLMANNVICDWREPDVIRIAPVPLYNSFSDVRNFVEILFK